MLHCLWVTTEGVTFCPGTHSEKQLSLEHVILITEGKGDIAELFLFIHVAPAHIPLGTIQVHVAKPGISGDEEVKSFQSPHK